MRVYTTTVYSHADHIIQFLVDEPDAVVGVEHDGHERADGDDEYLRLLLR